jgi:hypothetical protein
MPAVPWTARGPRRREAPALATVHDHHPVPASPTTSQQASAIHGDNEQRWEKEMASPDLAVQDVIETLDSFYCHNVVAGSTSSSPPIRHSWTGFGRATM